MKGAAVIVVIISVIQWLLHVTYEEPWNPLPPYAKSFPKIRGTCGAVRFSSDGIMVQLRYNIY